LIIDAKDAGLLRDGPWFGRLPGDLQQLIVDRSVERTFRKGEYPIREGEPGKGMGVVLEGQVHLVRRVAAANEVLVDVGEAGFWFGNYGALTGGAPSIGSIVATGPVRAMFLPLAEFERIVGDEPRYYRLFSQALIDRYAHLYRHLAEIHGLPPEEWLRTRLLELAEVRRDATAQPRSAPVDLSLSHTDLARMIGVSRQTIAGLLARLEARGLVEIGFRNIRVLG
jgi:CRP-like cAMP-binding protein